jgi:hypothetical protein
MRILLWLLPTCLALTACNMALSDHPMLSGEPKSAIKFKDGVWAAEDPDCKFNVKRPARRWPKCANWLVIDNGKVVGGPDAKPGEVPVEFVIAEGEPPILEFPLTDEGEKTPKGYAYLAIEPTASDAGGATAINLWGVACGTERVPGSTREIDPYPGIDKDCHPQSVSALRAAAVASRPSAAKVGRMKWIRAGAN